MGGKAIEIAQRVPKERFFNYANDILPRVEQIFNTEVHMVNSFYDKKDFGDLDVLVLADRDFGDRMEIIKNEFNPVQVHKNSHIISFAYKGEEIYKDGNEYLQVDLIFTPLDNWETSKIFFCNGDLGNFMGKLVNSYGKLNHHGYLLKYGYDGLKCKIVHGGKSKKVFLTKDSQEVFNLLGLSFKRWKQGFHNKEEMFDYVISSPMFDYRAFQWENISSINKHRNKRRPNYHIFLEYIEKHKHRVIDWAPYTDYLDILKDRFNVDLKEEMEKLKQLVKEDKEIKYKFNGQLIMEKFPHLKGKELGDTMTEFKNQFKDWRKYALSTSSEEIMEHFKNKINEKGRL
jgi:hypothetical protein